MNQLFQWIRCYKSACLNLSLFILFLNIFTILLVCLFFNICNEMSVGIILLPICLFLSIRNYIEFKNKDRYKTFLYIKKLLNEKMEK